MDINEALNYHHFIIYTGRIIVGVYTQREEVNLIMNRRNTTVLVSLLLCLCMLAACAGGGAQNEQAASGEQAKLTKEVYAMDTVMDLTIYGFHKEGKALSETELGEVMNQAVALINRLEGLFSVTKQDSDIAKINAAGGKPVTVADETYDLLQKCLHYSDITDGMFDISIYPLVKLWGFTTGEYHVPTEQEIRKVQDQIDYKKIRLSDGNNVQIEEGMQIDLGAAAKGYLSQKLMDLFRTEGIESAIVSLGGNVQAMGKKEDGSLYNIGLVDPADGTSIYGTLEVEDRAVITSGIYQRYFEKDGQTWHHIMDKGTGKPADNGLASVTVVTADGSTGDALATALYVMGEEKAVEYQKKHPEIEIILIRKDGSLWQSDELLKR